MTNQLSDIRLLIRTDINAARDAARDAFEAIQLSTQESEIADIYHILGLVEFYDNKSKEAITWYNKELKIRERINDRQGASSILNNMGVIFYNKGKLDVSIDYYQKALAYRESLNDLKGIAGVSDNIGVVLFRSGLAAEAFKMHFRALEINRSLADNERICISLQNIGLTYLSQKDYKHALDHFKEALSISRNIGEKARTIQLMINIGSTLSEQKNIIEAKSYYEQCFAESKAANYPLGLLISLKSLAHIQLEQGYYSDAIKFYEDCINIARKTDHITEISTALSGIGRSYAALENYSRALEYFNSALKMARKSGMKETLSYIYISLSDVHEKLKDHKKSLDFYKKHIAIRDELVNRENTRTINEIKTRYEVEKKEKEAQLLKEKNEAINVYARKLEASNNSLKQFAHVASHDLREPLRMVSSYMGLLEKTLGDNISAHQKQFLDFAIDGAKRMDTLIHDLLHLAKVDADPKIERVALADMIAIVRSNLQILLHEKNAQIIAHDMPVIMADRTQVLQLLQNIISNGIKYNESAQPTITITYQADGAEAVLRIADNGIGIDPDLREHAFELFRRVHTDNKYQGSGIGLAICRKIVDGLGGTISIEGNKGGGSVFRIGIPISLVQ